jgi:hypothetical protein
MKSKPGVFGVAVLTIFVMFVITSTVARGQTDDADAGPALRDLYWALNGGVGSPPLANWQALLDTDFSNWRTGGSENKPPIAHAIALWMYPQTDPNTVSWWNTFFDCQNGGQPCVVPGVSDPGSLKYMKGSELMSDTYDSAVTTAVASVNYWAYIHGNTTLQNKARRYLRVTFTMYALAAGPGPIAHYVGDYGGTLNMCQIGSAGYFFTGPFISAAGMRSTPEHNCTDDRGPLLTRALQWRVTNKREQADQAQVCGFLEQHWPLDTGVYENVYALDPSNRSLLMGQLNSGNAASTLSAALAGVRTMVVYRLLGWQDAGGNQIRLTVMESNRNHNTAAMYAEMATYSDGVARSVFPWANQTGTARQWRHGITDGYAKLLPNVFFPTQVEGSNIGPGDTPNAIHGTIVKTIDLPVSTATKEYHVVLSPTQDAYLQ